MAKRFYWTLVQHSGFGYAGKANLERGLEVRQVSLKRDIDTINRVGGVLFDTYEEARKAEEEWPYQNAPEGSLIPQVQGTFSDKEIDGLRIYVPVRKAVG